MTGSDAAGLAKVPAVTAGFWAIKILATTLGETAGDTVSMTLDLGYLLGTMVFAAALVALATLQIRALSFRPVLYWSTIIASTTAGTTLADFATRSLGIGYAGGSALLAASVAGALLAWYLAWYLALGSVSVHTVVEARAEVFYWITITLSQTLGTALGDWAADSGGLGYLGGATLFALSLGVIVVLRVATRVSGVWLFWSAFVLTRPLGATVGDFIDKPIADGGLALSRPLASVLLLAVIVVLTCLLPQRAARRA